MNESENKILVANEYVRSVSFYKKCMELLVACEISLHIVWLTFEKKRFIIRLLRFSFIRESFYFLPFFFRKFSHSSLKYSLPPPTPPTLSFIGSVLVSILVVGGRGETAVWKSQVFAVFSSFGIRKQHFLCWYWSKKRSENKSTLSNWVLNVRGKNGVTG